MRTLETRVIDRLLKSVPNVNSMPDAKKALYIKIELMDEPEADPDDPALVERILNQMKGLLARFKFLTGITDDEIAEIIKKSRPTVQAYIGGRLREVLEAEHYDKLRAYAESRKNALTNLIDELAFMAKGAR